MNSIRRRLSRELLTALLLLLGGGLLGLYIAARTTTIERFDDALHAKALAISTLTTWTDDGIKLNFSDRFFRGFDDDRSRDFFQLWDARGQVLARSDSLERGENLPLQVGRFNRPERWNLTLPNGRAGRAVGFTFRPRGAGDRERNRDDRHPDDREVQLVVASDRREVDEILWQLLGISAGCGTLLVLGTAWIVPRVLRRGLRPLDELGEQVRRVDASSLATRIPSEGMPVEVQPVTARLNDLLKRLEQSFERERRFSADLAHELRTPLAELRAQAECALKWPESRDPETDRETLAITQHMEAIVAHILTLARGEQGSLPVSLESVDFGSLVHERWTHFEPRATERQLSARFELSETAVSADRVLLRSILTNLFENAVSHAPQGGEVVIKLAPVDGDAELQIANPAGDLRPDEVSKLFERFWRKEAARSGGLHVGLGLSLARGYAEAMGWTLTAALQPEGWITFRLRGPRSPSAG